MPFTINAAINNFLNSTTNTGTTISSTSSSSSTATNNHNTNHLTLGVGVGAGNGGGTINTSQSQSKLITHTLLPQSTLNFNSHAIINTNNHINSTTNNNINSNNITMQALQQSSVTPSSSHDGSSKHINGMMMTDSNSASSMKGSFRCGHCGQISNWKHVIQVFTNKSKNKNKKQNYRLSYIVVLVCLISFEMSLSFKKTKRN